MLRVVTTNNVEVFRHLGSGPFQRMDVAHTIAASFDEAISKIREAKPQIAIIDVELAGGSGYDLCKQLKSDADLKGIHVMMVLSSVISRDSLTALEACGCDDVLAVPIHSDDFYHHIAQVAGLPLRRDRRMGVTLEINVAGSLTPLEGVVDNVSSGGAGVTVAGKLEGGQELTARLMHDGEEYPNVRATVAWTQPPSADGKTVAGVAFDDLPMKTRLLLERLCLYDISQSSAGDPTVSLYGDFTEITDFASLSQRLENEDNIDFHMRSVRYISSAGVRAWCDFLAKLKGKSYTFRHCSMAFVSQAAMVPMSLGDGRVLSLEAPYRCETCDRDDLRLLEEKTLLREAGHVVPPLLKCGTCTDDLEFDDVPDRYFAFLKTDK